MMQINKLKLNNFRNFEKYILKPEKVNLLLGPNGVGKTNLIEAIYLLSVCRSYRTRKDAEIIKWNDCDYFSPARGETDLASSKSRGEGDKEGISGLGTARVEVEATSDKGDDINIAVAQTGEKKIALVGNKSVPVSMLVGSLPTVIFTPESMDLPEAPPTKRRRTLDVLLAQIDPKYTQTLLRYNQIIKARNKLLDGISKGCNRENELDFWDKQLIDLGTKILTTRLDIVKELNSLVGESFEKISSTGDNKRSIRKLSFEYLSTIENIDRFDEELVAVREQELRYGNTVIGPHRDDWQMKFDGVDIRISASRGETRAALLALKMGEMDILRHKRDELPILLLDDVFAELDKRHSESLLGFFDGSQTFITATDAEYIPKSIMEKAKVIRLSQNPNLKNQNDNVE